MVQDVWVQMLLDAIASGRLEEVRCMLGKGSDPNVLYCYADTARLILGEEDFLQMQDMSGVPMSGDSVFTTTPLITALVSRQKLEMLRFLLEMGADPNMPNKPGETPLMFSQSLPATRLLVKHGADPHARDNKGYTTLIHSPKDGITKYLIELGVDVNAAGKDGRTALIHSPGIESTEALLAAGADPNARTTKGETALMYASDMRRIELLLAAGADASLVDDDGMTPLHYAAILNHHRVIPFWAERFDVNTKDKGGRTPYDLALDNDATTSRHLLLRLGGYPAEMERLMKQWNLSNLCPDILDEIPEKIKLNNPYGRN